VKRESIPFGEFFATLTAQSAAKNLADVVAADGPNITGHAYNGQIQPLDGIFTDAELKEYDPATIQAGMYKGKLYGLMIASSAIVFYYNVDMMNAAGIAPATGLSDAWTPPSTATPG